MAADRHNGFLKNAVNREQIKRFPQNLTHTGEKLLLSWGSPQNLRCWKWKLKDGGQPQYWSSIQYNNSQSVKQIFKKFDLQMRKNSLVIPVTFNTRCLRIEDGDRPPSWISKNCYYFPTA
jgi:hypothetical protein